MLHLVDTALETKRKLTFHDLKRKVLFIVSRKKLQVKYSTVGSRSIRCQGKIQTLFYSLGKFSWLSYGINRSTHLAECFIKKTVFLPKRQY